MSTRPQLTQREAATATGLSRTTIRRRETGSFPDAVFDEQRGWLIPIDNLLATGLRVNAPAPPDPGPGQGTAPAGADEEHGQADEVAALRAELERARHEHEQVSPRSGTRGSWRRRRPGT
ncbi:hypothetical protein PV396_44355 [Streptomyces sp. ME02-8801-2C]|uniref:hypothetical protein n=1 Tax=Streptomyces sp. ME02-8801-2C TaxID=3028680 RepID=UPI0029B000F5|nr:hypothetical protein [Streptomyces sp. ME02-8801-2C]MDX3458879.1 hypothetical protein [Streptomyces sp. ME02-8801-2C]